MFSEKPLAAPPTDPRLRILSYREYVEETETGLKEILAKNEILKFSNFRHGKEFSIETRGLEDPLVVPLYVSINAQDILRDIGPVITIGRAIFDLIIYLKKRRQQGKIYRFTINCSSTYYVALNFLKSQGVGIGKPLYFRSFGWNCLTITNDINRKKVIHIVIYTNEGELSDYTELSI
jgi:hypothetical protein